MNCIVCKAQNHVTEINRLLWNGASDVDILKVYGSKLPLLNRDVLRIHRQHMSKPESIVLSPPGLPSIELEPVDIEEAYDSLTRGCYRLLQAEMAYQMSNPSAADPKRFTVLLDAFNKLTGGRDIDNAVSLITRAGFEVIDPTGMLSAEVVDAAKD